MDKLAEVSSLSVEAPSVVASSVEASGVAMSCEEAGVSASSEKIISINEGTLKRDLRETVRLTVEETLNRMLDAEADALCQAKRYERTAERASTRAGHYTRTLETQAGEVKLKMPKLRAVSFETAIIERYRRRESSVEEALIEMYLAGVSVRRVEDITEALWGSRVSASTVSDLNQKVYARIDEWRNRPLAGEYAYVYLDGLWLKRCWAGEVRNVSVLVAIGVNEAGYREVLGAEEGVKEDAPSWLNFLRRLKERGLKGVRLVVSDKCLGLLSALMEVFPGTLWQRCAVHFYRDVFSKTPHQKMREVAAMLKAIHAQEDLAAAEKKAGEVAFKLEGMKLKEAAKIVRAGAMETLSYLRFPSEHWRHLKTNNMLERSNRECRRRTRVVGSFPDGKSALMLVSARLRYQESKNWSQKRYLNPEHLRGWTLDRDSVQGVLTPGEVSSSKASSGVLTGAMLETSTGALSGTSLGGLTGTSAGGLSGVAGGKEVATG